MPTELVFSASTLVAIIIGVWKMSNDMASIRSRMADKTELAVLSVQVANLTADVATITKSMRN